MKYLSEYRDPTLARSLVNTVVGMRVMAKVNPDRQQLEDMVSVALTVLD